VTVGVQAGISFLVARRGDGEVLVMDRGPAMLVLPVVTVGDQRADVSRQTRISSIGGVGSRCSASGLLLGVRRNEGVQYPLLRTGKAKGYVNRQANSWPNPRLTARKRPLRVLREKHGYAMDRTKEKVGVRV
jgi:hypothetical protein